MGYLHLNSGTIQEFNVEKIANVLHLTIVTDLEKVMYRICADLNEGPLEVIKDELNMALDYVKNNESHFIINEYPERNYIFITYPNNGTKKYTGRRLV